MDRPTRERLIAEHLQAIRDLETAAASPTAPWPPQGYYLLWHVVVGMMLGAIGAAVSLAFNAIGAPLFGKPPLELIRVYLTFPMGERALASEAGLAVFIGSVLYLVTGALYGVAFHLVMSIRYADAPASRRFLVSTALGLGLWIANFYLVLSWLQPALQGGSWIVSLVPWWVGMLTHLAFAWTMFVIEYWGRFVPYAQAPARA